MKSTPGGRKAQLEDGDTYGGRAPGESAEDHVERIALSATYPMVNDLAAELLQALRRLREVEARLAELQG